MALCVEHVPNEVINAMRKASESSTSSMVKHVGHLYRKQLWFKLLTLKLLKQRIEQLHQLMVHSSPASNTTIPSGGVSL